LHGVCNELCEGCTVVQYNAFVTSWCCIACCTIAQKLQEAVAALDHCDLHSGLHRAGELAEVICKLGAAIRTLRELDL
jgi:hypothetical protein